LFFGLTWLGMSRIHAPVGQGAAIDVSNKIMSSRAFIEASNPKTVQFYCSFLLPFTDPDASLGLSWQLFLLGACANLPFSADLPCILLTHPLYAGVSPRGRALCLISRCAVWSPLPAVDNAFPV
jgi:threonine/homoserine/homoserine lactone efflux protein